MKQWKRRLTSALLTLSVLLSFFPTARAAEQGTFYLAAATADVLLIEPEAVSYTAGQTVAQALQASGHTFTGLEQGYIEAVDGTAGSYYLCYDGGYDVNVSAQAITALYVSQNERTEGDFPALVKRMGEYNSMDSGVQQYAAAQTAYQTAVTALKQGKGADAALSALNQAIQAYQTIISAEKKTVTFAVTQGGQVRKNCHIALTASYGAVFEADGNSIEAAPDIYSYVVSDGGCNRAEGTVIVTQDGAAVSAALPDGEWFGNIELLPSSGSTAAYETTGTDSHSYVIPDQVSGAVYLYAQAGSIPDKAATKLYACYEKADGTQTNISRSWNSRVNALTGLLSAGMEDKSVALEARYATENYTMIQSCQLEVKRSPTLSDLKIMANGEQLPLRFAYGTQQYTLPTTAAELQIMPTAFGAYTVFVNEETLDAAGSKTVPTGSVSVRVTADNGTSTVYTVACQQTAAAEVTITHDAAVSVKLYNALGAEVPQSGSDSYQLTAGEQYSYIAEKDIYYHTTASFQAEKGQTIAAVTPQTENWLTALQAAGGTTQTSLANAPYAIAPAFAADTHQYTCAVTDNSTAFALWAQSKNNRTITAQYTKASDSTVQQTAISSGAVKGVSLSGVIQKNGCGAEVTVRVSETDAEVTHYQDYQLNIRRVLHSTAITLSADGTALALSPTYERDTTAYTVETAQETAEAELSVTFPAAEGYTAKLTWNGATTELPPQSGSTVTTTLPLDAAKDSETVSVAVCFAQSDAVSTAYTIDIHKLKPIQVRFETTPADAVTALTDSNTGKRVWANADGVFSLMYGHSYAYIISKTGYCAETGAFAAEHDQTISKTLKQAEINTAIDTGIPSEWSDFRGNGDNNAVTSAPIPTTDENAVLYWANPLGDGYSSGAVGSPILADSYLYTYAGTHIYKIDTVTGNVIATGDMAGSSSFAINSLTYAEGMIFVGLSNGRLQAFNADTLDSLWIYHDALLGQPNCGITYSDGYLYTGFWKGETAPANFVCLTITDEDPSQTLEEKSAVWTHTVQGGYYWVGACVRGDYLLVGTDDGASGYSTGHASLLSLNSKTGQVIDSLTMPEVGDIRCAVTYDKQTDSYYFTSKGGQFYRVKTQADGSFVPNSLQYINLQNGTGTASMSTSTPVIYNGRAYVGVCGSGQFTAYSGHNITVLDLNSWSIAYSVPCQGYPQTSGLLTTAYSSTDGTVYIYFFDNYTPGKLRVIQDKAGQTAASYTTTESYTANGKPCTAETAYALFTPSGAQAQYAICSPITDKYGTIYFKNDSGCLMAVGSTITKLEVTKQPDKRDYTIGECFDAAGMQVTATYSNGTTRDVTSYIAYSADALTAEDTELQLRFDHVLYQNQNGQSGVTCNAPTTSVDLTIQAQSHTHQYTETVTKQATCKEAGIRTHTCTICGATTTETIPKLETHTWDSGNITKQPTTTEEGVKTYTCTVCGTTKTESIPKLTPEPEPVPTITFTDVPAGEYYAEPVSWAVSKGITNGTSANTFSPTDTCIRGQIVTFLWRAKGSPEPTGTNNPFGDVYEGDYYYRAVLWAVEKGITAGTSANTFSPNDGCTRAQVAAFLWRAEGQPNNSGNNPFADVPTGQWYTDAVLWAVSKGITNGTSANTFSPDNTCTRGQIVTFLYRDMADS